MSAESTTTIHIAYDDRIIDQAFESLFGQKLAAASAFATTETRCGKRVPSRDARTRNEASCAECIASHDKDEADNAVLLDDMLASWPEGVPMPDSLSRHKRKTAAAHDPDHWNPAEGGNRASDDYWG